MIETVEKVEKRAVVMVLSFSLVYVGVATVMVRDSCMG